jgi:cardiolipin synthase
MPRWVNLPNLFTSLRIVAMPFIALAVLSGRHVAALALFLAAGITDLVDGALARRLNCATQAGAYLDPVADKVLLGGVYLTLAFARIVPWWFVALVFGRDLYILAAAGLIMLTTAHRKFPPSRWGKYSTFFQISAAVAWMVRNAAPSAFTNTAATALLWTSAALTVISGLHYTWRGAQLLRRH